MAIKTDVSHARAFIREDVLVHAQKKAEAEIQRLFARSGAGPEWLGWLDLLENPDDALLSEIDTLAAEIRRDADVLVVVGIGGSYLGAKAVTDALLPAFPEKGPEILFAGHHMGGAYHQALLDYLDRPKADGSAKSVYVNVISKSGTTLEPALAFRSLRTWMENRYGDAANKRIIATTSPESGALNKIIAASGYRKFIIPDNVGGRFSVLTPVGLLPIAVAGIDIRSLFYGAVDALSTIKKDPSAMAAHVATRYAFHSQNYAIDLIASFEPELKSFGAWMQQLMGESEGKNGKGLFPALLAFSTDLHSVGQMVQDGMRNQIETFLVVENHAESLTVSEDRGNEDGLNYLTGKTYAEINAKAFEGTLQAHIEGGVPVIVVSVPERNASEIGSLILYFEVLTAAYVYCLGENPFDQPGVEAYKKAMFRLLGKP